MSPPTKMTKKNQEKPVSAQKALKCYKKDASSTIKQYEDIQDLLKDESSLQKNKQKMTTMALIQFKLNYVIEMHKEIMNINAKNNFLEIAAVSVVQRFESCDQFLCNTDKAIQAARNLDWQSKSTSTNKKDKDPLLLVKVLEELAKLTLDLFDILCNAKSAFWYKNFPKALQVVKRNLQNWSDSPGKLFMPLWTSSVNGTLTEPDNRTEHLKMEVEIVTINEKGKRTLGHLFLFDDVILCTEYKDLGNGHLVLAFKWMEALVGVKAGEDESTGNSEEAITCAVRTLLGNSFTSKEEMHSYLLEKEKESYPFAFGSQLKINKRKILLFSNFERAQWMDAIKSSKANAKSVTISEGLEKKLVNWLSRCRKILPHCQTSATIAASLGRSPFIGDVHVRVTRIKQILPAGAYVDFQVESSGHILDAVRINMGDSISTWHKLQLMYSNYLKIKLCSSQEDILYCGIIKLSRNYIDRCIKLTLGDCELQLELEVQDGSLAFPEFGKDLLQQCRGWNPPIPYLICCCVNEVESRGLNEEGIYRVSCSHVEHNDLKTISEKEGCCFKDKDIYLICSILKQYLKDLPEPLFPYEAAANLYRIYDIDAPDHQKMREIFQNMPQENKDTIIYLLHHLRKVAQNSDKNKMTSTNLATVFGPACIQLPQKTVVDPLETYSETQKLNHIFYYFLEHIPDDVENGIMEPTADIQMCLQKEGETEDKLQTKTQTLPSLHREVDSFSSVSQNSIETSTTMNIDEIEDCEDNWGTMPFNKTNENVSSELDERTDFTVNAVEKETAGTEQGHTEDEGNDLGKSPESIESTEIEENCVCSESNQEVDPIVEKTSLNELKIETDSSVTEIGTDNSNIIPEHCSDLEESELKVETETVEQPNQQSMAGNETNLSDNLELTDAISEKQNVNSSNNGKNFPSSELQHGFHQDKSCENPANLSNVKVILPNLLPESIKINSPEITSSNEPDHGIADKPINEVDHVDDNPNHELCHEMSVQPITSQEIQSSSMDEIVSEDVKDRSSEVSHNIESRELDQSTSDCTIQINDVSISSNGHELDVRNETVPDLKDDMASDDVFEESTNEDNTPVNSKKETEHVKSSDNEETEENIEPEDVCETIQDKIQEMTKTEQDGISMNVEENEISSTVATESEETSLTHNTNQGKEDEEGAKDLQASDLQEIKTEVAQSVNGNTEESHSADKVESTSHGQLSNVITERKQSVNNSASPGGTSQPDNKTKNLDQLVNISSEHDINAISKQDSSKSDHEETGKYKYSDISHTEPKFSVKSKVLSRESLVSVKKPTPTMKDLDIEQLKHFTEAPAKKKLGKLKMFAFKKSYAFGNN